MYTYPTAHVADWQNYFAVRSLVVKPWIQNDLSTEMLNSGYLLGSTYQYVRNDLKICHMNFSLKYDVTVLKVWSCFVRSEISEHDIVSQF